MEAVDGHGIARAAVAAVCFGPESMAAYDARPDLAWHRDSEMAPLRIAVAWPCDGASAPALASSRPLTATPRKSRRHRTAPNAVCCRHGSCMSDGAIPRPDGPPRSAGG
ncbi:hypothetical protein Acsp04_58350 [Actinomadura sp. NBRC 104425]|nr:hypothetical protein Acsp04_58350 [Actinomadura sp. NBRC 104425]